MDDCRLAVADFHAALLSYPPLNPPPTFASPPLATAAHRRFYRGGGGGGDGPGPGGVMVDALPTPEIRDDISPLGSAADGPSGTTGTAGAGAWAGAGVWVDVIDMYRLFRSVPARTDLLSAVQVCILLSYLYKALSRHPKDHCEPLYQYVPGLSMTHFR